ncbi:MAG: hypothetical protein ACRC7O_11650 [Fimbriiglobus sp.]
MDEESDDDGLSYNSFEGHLVSTLVLADVDAVAAAVVGLVPGAVWQPFAAGRELELRPRSYLVVRYAGRRWTTVLAWHAWHPGDWDHSAEARALSKSLNTKVIAYSCADSAGEYQYDLFRRGKRIEQWRVGEESEFRSTFRDEVWAEEGDPYTYLDAFFRDQQAYEPGWSFDDYFAQTTGASAVGQRVVPNTDETVERLDWVAGPTPNAEPGAATDTGS